MGKNKNKRTNLSLNAQKPQPKPTSEQGKKQVERPTSSPSATPQRSSSLPWPRTKEHSTSRENYRFLNPYNFVRYLDAPTIAPDDPATRLLGRCAPPPHDRYVGLTGRITCSLKTVTPLFVSDSHDVQVTNVLLSDGREVQHKSYRFFQYDGQDAIPATSIRGMIRSLFEAVTNAPFTVFNGSERLEYRIDPIEAQRFKPGIVQSLPDGDQPGVILLCEEAKIGAYYEDPDLNVLQGEWRCGEEAYAIISSTKQGKGKGKGAARVEAIARERDRNRLLRYDKEPKKGWIKITGRTIETKCNERFFYFEDGSTKEVLFDKDREDDFNEILSGQLQEHGDSFRSRIQSERLAPGNLVYVKLELDGVTVRDIALVKVARLRYRHSIGDLLPSHLKPSERYEELDIASRVFGWVKEQAGDDRTDRVAYAGRVRFSHATLKEDAGVYSEPLRLAILGSPKPTTTLFYLRKKNGEWSQEERKKPGAASHVGYDGHNQLRGRKFYRHHGPSLNRLEYERAGQRTDHQNRTVRGVRAPGNVFTFTIDFRNLAPVELGALLWTLSLGEEKCFFRLGYAKPLGFGSVKLEVDQVELLDPIARYRSLQASGWRRASTTERGRWIAAFEEAMKRCYGKPVRELPNIIDLMTLLRDPVPALPIHYPRTDVHPDPEGKNFEWFVANKVKSDKPTKAGPNFILELPGNEKGLPLLRKLAE
ncbi:CRISPR-associated RAMP family protein [Chloroflexus islandicus]|uniref:CRISPR-associated RAMP family protein n=1 Tax=Chloroflexus islandicus TaxID=1707952 RepID=A0A178M7C6_9CHLR|nr:TIGR03986 family CRISPR-associated RAMP protein [Chloroflexus islandicus]OAN43794.1 CRISPR-associated RAMP family protein [Chloroflexus islandicus]